MKEKLSDITKKAIEDRAFSTKNDELFSEFDDDEHPQINIEEVVDEIIEFAYLAAAEGEYEFEVGSDYIQKFGARNYDKISSLLKHKLCDVIIIKWRNRKNLKVFWGNNEV